MLTEVQPRSSQLERQLTLHQRPVQASGRLDWGGGGGGGAEQVLTSALHGRVCRCTATARRSW